jgi:putative transposase
MSARDIQAHLAEIYGTQVSPDLISRVTDAVIDEVQGLQARPLDAVWPIVFLDSLLKVRDQGVIQTSCVHAAEARPLARRRFARSRPKPSTSTPVSTTASGTTLS